MACGEPSWYNEACKQAFDKPKEAEVSIYGGIPVFKSPDPDSFTFGMAADVMEKAITKAYVGSDWLEKATAESISDRVAELGKEFNHSLSENIKQSLKSNILNPPSEPEPETAEGDPEIDVTMPFEEVAVAGAVSFDDRSDKLMVSDGTQWVEMIENTPSPHSHVIPSHSHGIGLGGYGAYQHTEEVSKPREVACVAEEIFIINAPQVIVQTGTEQINLVEEINHLKEEVEKLKGTTTVSIEEAEIKDPFDAAMRGI